MVEEKLGHGHGGRGREETVHLPLCVGTMFFRAMWE